MRVERNGVEYELCTHALTLRGGEPQQIFFFRKVGGSPAEMQYSVVENWRFDRSLNADMARLLVEQGLDGEPVSKQEASVLISQLTASLMYYAEDQRQEVERQILEDLES